jgi:hypothetical protein
MTRGLRAARPFLPLVLLVVLALPAAAQPAGTMTWGAHVTLATRWLDTSETESEITPFMILYALHDALVKPMRQLQEMDRKKREEMLHQIQRVLADRVVFAPIRENGSSAPTGRASRRRGSRSSRRSRTRDRWRT